MSLFDFAAFVGQKLFTGKDDAAAAIKKAIEADNPGIENLGVEFTKGFVKLLGNAKAPEAVEKAILIAGNVHGVEKVISSIAINGEVLPEDASIPTNGKVEYYSIKSGDTLSAIAKHFYGDANKYQQLFEANREVIKHPDKIFPGQKIRVPLA